jgi:antitoxin component of MazEF toxin-antitoxin module
MLLKLQKIGNSFGVIFPKEELEKRGYRQGQLIEVDLLDDPFWDEIKQFSKEERRAADSEDGLALEDDLDEWNNL